MEQFEKRNGTFNPVRTNDLSIGAARCIGMYCKWEALWIIDEGEYEGQCGNETL